MYYLLQAAAGWRAGSLLHHGSTGCARSVLQRHQGERANPAPLRLVLWHGLRAAVAHQWLLRLL